MTANAQAQQTPAAASPQEPPFPLSFDSFGTYDVPGRRDALTAE